MKYSMIWLAAALALAAGWAPAQTIGQAPIGAPRVPASHSVEQADATLAQVAKDRAAVQERYAASEKLCYDKFFVNNCLDQAKEIRRAALAELRAVEVEASHFKRQDSVDKRDAELAERARKDAEDEALRMQQAPKAAKELAEAPRAPQPGPSAAEREAAHESKVQRQQAAEAANAGKRAANVAAFEKKALESQQRQAAVLKKQADAAKKKADREADEQKRAAAAAAAAASASKH